MSKTIGIDLGTTNSLAAVVENGRPRILLRGYERLVPSVVGLSDDGKIIVGQSALNQYVIAPERTVRSIKRKMGTDEKVTLGDREYSPEEISAFILRHLKTMAEEVLGEPVTSAVITVPAYFSDTQRLATKRAGELAGLEVLRILAATSFTNACCSICCRCCRLIIATISNLTAGRWLDLSGRLKQPRSPCRLRRMLARLKSSLLVTTDKSPIWTVKSRAMSLRR